MATAQPATSVALNDPFGVAVDKSGNVYIADTFHSLVEEVTPSGNLTVIAGGGTHAPSTIAQTATSVKLSSSVGGVYVDKSGNVYIGDTGNRLVEEVSGGMLTVIAGGGTNAPSTTAQSATSVKLGFYV